MSVVRYLGYFNEPSGLGAAARYHALALHGAGVRVQAAPIGLTPRGPVHLSPDRERFPELAHLAGDEGIAPVEILHTLPSTFPLLRHPGRRTVGLTTWEAEVLPSGWREAARHVDELWVPSRFVAGAFAALDGVPTRVVPHPVQVAETARAGVPQIPDDLFVFLAVLEWQDRKNPQGLLKSFFRAFAGRRDVALVLKLGRLFFRDDDEVDRSLARLCGGLLGSRWPRVYLVREVLSPETVAKLYARADAYVSLHRAEGFGLCMAEAMAAGRAVVATDYSGNTDFMDRDSAYLVESDLVPAHERYARGFPWERGMRWAEPRADAAVDQLRACVRDGGDRAARAARGRARVVELLAPTRVGALMRDHLEEWSD